MVAEISMEKKKCQKLKTKSSDGRKQLSSVRVIQRNLVYIVGLPLNLADEDVVSLSLSLSHICTQYFQLSSLEEYMIIYSLIFFAASPAPRIFWSVW